MASLAAGTGSAGWTTTKRRGWRWCLGQGDIALVGAAIDGHQPGNLLLYHLLGRRQDCLRIGRQLALEVRQLRLELGRSRARSVDRLLLVGQLEPFEILNQLGAEGIRHGGGVEADRARRGDAEPAGSGYRQAICEILQVAGVVEIGGHLLGDNRRNHQVHERARRKA